MNQSPLILPYIFFCFFCFQIQNSSAENKATSTKEQVQETPSLEEQILKIKNKLTKIKNTGTNTDVLYLKNDLLSIYIQLSQYDKAVEMKDELLKDISQLGKKNDSIQCLIFKNLGYAYLQNQNTEEALKYFNRIRVLAKDSNSFAMACYYHGIGIFSSTKLKDSAALYNFQKALNLYQKVGDVDDIYVMNFNIARILMVLRNDYKTVVPYLMTIQEFVLNEKIKEYRGSGGYQIMGAYYRGVKKYTLAEEYFQLSLKISDKLGQKFMYLSVLYDYAEMLSEIGQQQKAYNLAFQGLKYSEEIKDNNYPTIDFCILTSSILEKMGRYEDANTYLKKALDSYNTCLKKERNEVVKNMEKNFELYRLEQETVIQMRDLELAKAKLINKNLWIGGIGLLASILVLSVIILGRRVYTQCRINKIIKQRYQEQNQSQTQISGVEDTLKTVIDKKNKELISNSLLFLKLHSISEGITENFKLLENEIPLKPKQKMLAKEIRFLLNDMQTIDKGWENFELYFNEAERDFFERIGQLYPTLSHYEKRLCALFKLNMGNKEIAYLTRKTQQTIAVAKFRIKKKLQVDDDEKLTELLNILEKEAL